MSAPRIAGPALLAWAFLSLTFSAPAGAFSLPSLTNLAGDQLRDVSDTFAAEIMFKPVEPASSFGAIKIRQKPYGFGVGVQLSEVSAIRMRSFYTGTVGLLPGAMAVILGSGPYGLGVEFGAWPQLSFNGLSFEEYGGNFKWTFTDLWFPRGAPLHFALRLGVTRAGLNFTQKISGVDTAIDFDTTVLTAGVSASRKFGFVEPYAGFALFRQSSTLGYLGTVSIFNRSLTVGTEIGASSAHLLFNAGFQIRLTALALSLEYNDVGGINGYALKLGLKI